jgi:hypothetical protein
VNKDIFAPVIRCDESIALGRIKPLHLTRWHVRFSLVLAKGRDGDRDRPKEKARRRDPADLVSALGPA